MTFIYKIENEQISHNLRNWLRRNKEIHTHDTRSAKFFLACVNKKQETKSIFYMKMYLKSATNVSNFSKKIKKEIMDSYN